MNSSQIRRRLIVLQGKRNQLERKLISFRWRIVIGSLFSRYTECRKGGCRCTKGKPHGPFLYAAIFTRGRQRHEYVGKKEDQKRVEALKNYQVFKGTLEEIRHLGLEINTLWNAYRKELTAR